MFRVAVPLIYVDKEVLLFYPSCTSRIRIIPHTQRIIEMNANNSGRTSPQFTSQRSAQHMDREKKVLVIGHKNPDTDSIVSAIAYAELKQIMGFANCFAARCGNVNLQTEYVLTRFEVPPPEFINDLIPKVKYYMSHMPTTVPRDIPLWHALETLNKGNFKMLPIVDGEGRLQSILHFNAFAQNMLKKIDPNRKGIFPTSVSHMVKTLGAQPVVIFEEETIFPAQIVVAAYEFDAFKEHLDAMSLPNTIVLVGNRRDVHEYVIERQARVLVVTGGSSVSRELKKRAEEKSISILISPYDTSTTSWLTLYSSPVVHTGDTALKPLREDDYIGTIKTQLMESVSRSLPVVDRNDKVIGILSQSDLMRDPHIEIIMVDHNERSQAIDGIEHYRIQEIIDHHRLGNDHTNHPIIFINKPVGSTSTIIATLFQDYRVPMRKEIASILLAGILSDTLILHSATTTETDRHMAEFLSSLTDLPIDMFGKNIMEASSLVAREPVDYILSLDMKRFGEGKFAFTVSQVEVVTFKEIMDRKDDILEGLERLQGRTGSLFSALMVTDITELDSILFIKGDRFFISHIRYPKMDEHVYLLKGILSRKKQLIPILTEIIRNSQ
ncbi:MAG: putative manganese-dependent inorganic diphosphatase [Deltaproteobacteria bacterium]|nr:putative manganese-dependent inorganic diphosphatase [Deltaproteobacteria bacterium]